MNVYYYIYYLLQAEKYVKWKTRERERERATFNLSFKKKKFKRVAFALEMIGNKSVSLNPLSIHL